MSNVSPASVRAAAAINACAAAGRNASGVLSSAWSAIRPPAVFQSSVAQAEDAAPPARRREGARLERLHLDLTPVQHFFPILARVLRRFHLQRGQARIHAEHRPL